MVTAADVTHWTRITSVLAVDPGARTGWVLLLEVGGWHIVSGGVVSPDDYEWPGLRPDLVVIENPQIYPNGKARPADILTLARVVGRYQERFKEHRQELVTPREWKGTVPGDIMTKRIEAGLEPSEVAALKHYKRADRHNMIDAAGIGKWAVRQPFMRQPRLLKKK